MVIQDNSRTILSTVRAPIIYQMGRKCVEDSKWTSQKDQESTIALMDEQFMGNGLITRKLLDFYFTSHNIQMFRINHTYTNQLSNILSLYTLPHHYPLQVVQQGFAGVPPQSFCFRVVEYFPPWFGTFDIFLRRRGNQRVRPGGTPCWQYRDIFGTLCFLVLYRGYYPWLSIIIEYWMMMIYDQWFLYFMDISAHFCPCSCLYFIFYSPS